MKHVAVLAVAFMAGSADGVVQETGTPAEYRYVEVADIGALEKAMASAAAEGFAVKASSSFGLILHREGGNRVYKVVAARRDSTLIDELNEAGASGFHVVPNGALTSRGEWIVLLEKDSEGATFRYSGVKADDTGPKALQDGRKRGARIVAVFSKPPSEFGKAFGGNPPPLMILEEPHGASAATAEGREYRVVSTKRTGTLEREVQKAAADGFRPIGAGFMAVVLERDAGAAPRDYRVVATTRASTAQREVQQLAADGYRVVATPDSPNEWVLVLERGASPGAEYLFVQVDSRKADALLRPATGQGYRIAGMIESVVILEK